MRRVDRRTNALQTDRQTDTASYRGALSHLIKKEKEKNKERWENMTKVNQTNRATVMYSHRNIPVLASPKDL